MNQPEVMVGSWIEEYGYWGVFFGSVLEGETILIVAGYSVSRGYLDFLPTVLLATAGGMTGDLLYYVLGRRHGAALIRGFPVLRRIRARAVLFLRRWGRATAFATRFAYGLRIILPMLMGASRFRLPAFLLFNLFGAVSFAALYTSLGFLFGEVIEEILGRVRPYERWIILSLLLTGVAVWAVREWRLLRAPPSREP